MIKKFTVVLLVAGLSFSFQTRVGARDTGTVSNLPQTDQAASALQEGRRLLKRGKSDQALSQLQKALNLYTTAKNNHGIAATENELGDLYLRQGEYNVALDHYKHALEGFVGADKKNEQNVAAASLVDSRLANANIADDKFNANLMLAKIGDVKIGRASCRER